MTLNGVDYSYSGPMSAAQAKANGLAFVCRYVSSPGQAKNIRQSEVDDFKANGVGIVIVFENGTSSALNGYAQGIADATAANSQVSALGLAGTPIYFAVDFDAQPSQYPQLDAYFRGVQANLGLDRVGAYGGYYPIRHFLDNGIIRYAWQAIAWSNGNIDPRAHIFQDSGATVAGVDVDLDRTISSDTNYGQWNPQPPTPPEDTLSAAEVQQITAHIDAKFAELAASKANQYGANQLIDSRFGLTDVVAAIAHHTGSIPKPAPRP
jgi:Domain of unknown function (DUF1906)